MFTWSHAQKYFISIDLYWCLFTVLLVMPDVVMLSQWIGAGGCGCLSLFKVSRNISIAFMFRNNAPNYSSAADDATNLRMAQRK